MACPTSCRRPPTVRAGDWRVAPVPADLQDRRVEITGPVDRKMVINALNAPVRCFMADFEDSCAPTWENIVRGQVNLADAIRRTISYADAATGKIYRLADRTATLIVRPRGWHLPEKHVLVNGEAVSGALFDFAVYLANNHEALARAGTGPYFYLPKMESHLEARLWNDVFLAAQDVLGMPHGTIKATVLIETILAAFEMDEILYELREHSAGLNCGRWDYIFSFIKKFRNQPDFLLPDRGSVTMDRHFSSPTSTSSSRPVTGAALTPWEAWPRRFRSATTPGQTKPPWGGCARTSCGRRTPDTTAPGSLTRASRPSRGSIRCGDERTQPDRRAACRKSPSCRETCCGSRRERSPRPGCATASVSACSTSRPGCAAPAACRSTT